MGIAAYYRGNRAISAQYCSQSGCRGCVRCRPNPVPAPRPADWGNKAAARALDHARRIVAGTQRYGMGRPDHDTLAAAVQDRARVGRATARDAAALALVEAPC